ncbi:hypothetical protein ACHAWC_007247 [Mediolabrus comicus]
MSDDLTMKCKCGAFEAKFDTAPRIIFNCQCHSCVSVCKSIESKEGFDGISCKSDEDTGGIAMAIYKSNNCTVVKSDKDSIDFMKVGEKGKMWRPYCTKCGTMLFNVYLPNWCAVNRNCLTNSDGSAYVPPGGKDKVININCKSAFDPDKIGEPKHNAIPFGILFKFLPSILGLIGDGSNTEANLIPEDLDKVEVSPITWE